MRHRFYAPELRRFLTRDPLGLEGGANQYMYALLNPLVYYDPLGLCASGGGITWADAWNTTVSGHAYAIMQIAGAIGRAVSWPQEQLDKIGFTEEQQWNVAQATPFPLDDVAVAALGSVVTAGRGLSRLSKADNALDAMSVPKKTVVIGENMRKRVIPYADEIGATYYKASAKANPANWMKNNDAWIRRQMREGANIIDIGPDAARRTRQGASSFYEMEKAKVQKWNYPNYISEPQP